MVTKKAGELSPLMIKTIDTIISIMEEKGITPRMLCFDTGMDEGNLSKILNKKRGVTLERLSEILDYLGYSLVIEPKHKVIEGLDD